MRTTKKVILFCLFLTLTLAVHIVKADTELTVKPSGNATERAAKELRQFQHSDIEPTGLYVKKGDKLTITSKGVSKAKVFIGLRGIYKDYNDGKANTYTETDLKDGVNEISVDIEIGKVYIENLSETDSIKVSIKGGRSNPIYRLGETSEADFKQELQTDSDAPFFELVGKHVHGLFKMNSANISAINNRDSVKNLVDYLDDTMVSESESNGLFFGDKGSLGANYKSDNRVYLIDSDDGYAAAGGYVLYLGSEVIKDILQRKSGDDLWSFWHEMGHTYQNPYMMWGTDGDAGAYPSYNHNEVTVNINSLYVQHKEGKKGRVYSNPDVRENLKKYLSLSNTGKDYDTTSQGDFKPDTDSSVWLKVSFFNQLMLAYGFDVFAYVNQEYRLMYYSGETMPQTNEEKRQCFMKIVSKVTHRNLVDYFEKWGLHPNATVKEEMAKYDKPSVQIEDNLLPGQDDPIEDNVLPSLQTPTVTPKTVKYVLGEQPNDYQLDDLIESGTVKNMPSGDKISPTSQIITTNDLLDNSGVKVKLTNQEGQSNIITIPTEKSYGNAISMTAYASEERAIFTLQKKTKTIETYTDEAKTTALINGTGTYVTFKLMDKNGKVKKELSVNREDPPQDFVHALRNVTYEEGDVLELTVGDSGKLQSYKEGAVDLNRSDSSQKEYFKIENDQFTHLSATDLAPTGTAVEPAIKIGEALPEASSFVKNLKDSFGVSNLTVAFKQAPSVNNTGEQTGTITLTDKVTGLTTDVAVTVNVLYDNSLALAAYTASDVRSVLRLNASTHQIVGFANPDRGTDLNGGDSKYWEVKLIRNGETVKDVSAKGTDKPFDFTSTLNGLAYQEGDLVYVYAQQKYIQNYHASVLTPETYDIDNYFKIENDQFTHLSATDLAPTGTAVEPTIKIGEALPEASSFVKNLKDSFGGSNLTVEFKKTPSVNKAGEQTGTITLTDKVTGLTTDVAVTADIVYDNSLALAAYSSTDIRSVLRLDANTHQIVGFANPDRDTALDGNDSKYWEVKLIRNGETLKDVSAKGTDKPFDFTSTLNGLPYQEGDLVYVYAKAKYIENYQSSQLIPDTYTQENYFKIKNDQFIRVDNSATTITIINDHLIYEKDEALKEADLLKEADVSTESINTLSTDFSSELSGTLGDHTVTVTATNPVTGETASKPLTVTIVTPSFVLNGTLEFTDSDSKLEVGKAKEVHLTVSGQASNSSSAKNLELAHQFGSNHLSLGSTLSQKLPGKEWGSQTIDPSQALKLSVDQLGAKENYEAKYDITASEALSIEKGDQWKVTYSYVNEVDGISKTYTKTLDLSLKTETNQSPDPDPDDGGSTSLQKKGTITFREDAQPSYPVDPVDPNQPIIPDQPINPNGAELMITYASDINFGKQSKSETSWHALADSVKNEDDSASSRSVVPFVSIKDSRGTDRKGWKLEVTQDDDFKDSDGNVLKGANLTYSDLNYADQTNSPVATSGEVTLSKNASVIAQADATQGAGNTSLALGILGANQQTSGVTLSVLPGTMINSKVYTTTVTYELVAGA